MPAFHILYLSYNPLFKLPENILISFEIMPSVDIFSRKYQYKKEEKE